MTKLSLSICQNIAITILLIASKSIYAKDIIRWVKLDFAPFEINTPPHEGMGIIDLLKHDLQNNMPEYQHRDFGVVNQDRLMLNFEQEDICHGGLIKTPKIENTAYLSIGIGIMPTHAIITPANTNNQFAKQKSASLSLLLANPKRVTALPSRTFGPVIDNITETHRQQNNLYFRQAIDMHGLFEMLFKQRFDYTVGYPAEAIYWNRQNPDKPLAVIGIEELTEKYTIGRVACSKNEWGRKVISDINQKMLLHRLSDTYISSIFLPWVPEEFQVEYINDFHNILSKDTWSNAD